MPIGPRSGALLVNDESIVVDFYWAVLEKSGFDMDFTINGVQATQMITVMRISE